MNFKEYIDTIKDDVLDAIENSYVVLRDELCVMSSVGEELYGELIRGVTLRDPRTGFKGIGLNYTTDNLTETLIHECIHYAHEELTESEVESLTDDLFDDLEVRRASQKRIVDLCSKYDI